MKLILKCYSDNEWWEGGLDYAILDLTPNLAKLAVKRIERIKRCKAEDNQLYEMYYWDYCCEFFKYPDEEKHPELFKIVEGETFRQWDGTFSADLIAQIPEELLDRTECDQMAVSVDSIKWSVLPKNGNTYIHTECIPVELLKEIAGVQEEKPQPGPIETQFILSAIRDILWFEDGKPNPDKEWSADTVEAIAEVMEHLRPEEE